MALCRSLGRVAVAVATVCTSLAVRAGVCGPGAGDCFRSHDAPGCADPSCCTQVCALDPICCGISWDGSCVDLALALCEPFPSLIVAEPFDYAPVGATLPVVGTGGTGAWDGPWTTVPPAPSWAIVPPGLVYSDGVRALAVSGASVIGTSPVTRNVRAIAPPGGPLGDTPASVWLSMLILQSAGDSTNTYAGIKLNSTGASPFFFVGKPFNQTNLGIDRGTGPPDILISDTPVTETPSFVVVELVLRDGADDVYVWINPSLEGTPAHQDADIAAPGYGDFSGMSDVTIETGSSSGANTIVAILDEIRIAGSFGDVAPPIGCALISPTCCDLVCVADPFCCAAWWDGICGTLVDDLCSAICGGPDAGSCFSVHGTPYCNQLHCCESVCVLDPNCCTVAWDVVCVEAAFNNGECKTTQPCPGFSVFTCTGGCDDNFSSDNPEPASPGDALVAALGACNGLVNFDGATVNRCFAHTFSGCWPSCGAACPQPGCGTIVGATLEISMRALCEISDNDTVSLWDDGTGLWTVSIASLIGADWKCPMSATVVLDLAASGLPGTVQLPPAVSAAVMQSLCDGELGMHIQDDTSVDYVRLNVVVCPCENPERITIQVDEPDNFSTPTPTSPGTCLLSHVACSNGALQLYDTPSQNRCFIETISGLPDCLLDATLTIGIVPAGLWTTDGLALECVDTCDGVFAWGLSLPALEAAGVISPPLASGQPSVITLSLGNLPPSAAGVRSILPLLLDGSLDILLQDDTGVDFISIDVTTCAGCPGETGDPLGACCLPPEQPGADWNCAMVDEATCAMLDGAWYGSAVTCADISCKAPCIEPPCFMTGWWSFDEPSGEIAGDLTGYNNKGQLLPADNPPTPVGGMVGDALHFDGVNDVVVVPYAAVHDVGCGALSADAWIYPESGPNQGGTIVMRWDAGAFNGWALNLEPDGKLVLVMGTPCLRCIFESTPSVPFDTWTHVAFTATGCQCETDTLGCNPPGGTGRTVTVYINGVAVNTWIDACGCNLGSDSSVKIGGTTSPFDVGSPFTGIIDEVELFNSAIAPQIVKSIFDAGPNGKCKDSCHASWDRLVCANQDIITFGDATICNDSTVPRTYSWFVTPSALCPVSEATFTPSSGSVTVGPKDCATVKFALNVPPGSPFGKSCFNVTFINEETGKACTAMGTFIVSDCQIYTEPDNDITLLQGLVPTVVGFDVTALSPVQPASFDIVINFMDLGCFLDIGDFIFINGFPASEPVEGVVDLEVGVPKSLDFTLEWIGPDAFPWLDLQLSLDVNGDGKPETVSSIGLRRTKSAPNPCPADLNGDGVVDGADLGALLGDWGSVGVGDLNGDGVTNGADLGELLGAWGSCG